MRGLFPEKHNKKIDLVEKRQLIINHPTNTFSVISVSNTVLSIMKIKIRRKSMTEIGSSGLFETQSLMRKDKHVKKQLYHST